MLKQICKTIFHNEQSNCLLYCANTCIWNVQQQLFTNAEPNSLMDVLLVIVHIVFIIVLSNGARFDEILVEYLQNCEQVFCEEFYLEVVEICDKKILKCVNEWKQYYNCMKSCVRNEIAEGPKYIDLEEAMEKVRYSIEVETIEK
ncbi:hypothetical protein T4B_4060 [Trichinella pseudospiralis]|uniref:Uncharacterized protein n=2 Tax=Trichinella pseudospiralis TaxID=6337 RepID=A0A0V1I5W5_TRIPS|nr:hypothetical protein T4E_5552 [Trichinella pseudospiralis]KRY90373.1 hypothetical protein T4D_9568 [Trichinella pseudospiralis]KRZ18234.1 hypothetical protein T4B_4060 [Trichinella pseudospiralis]KRZ35158.1 hypothetical protein T4C_14144 [Trichinella pseudospiralis]